MGEAQECVGFTGQSLKCLLLLGEAPQCGAGPAPRAGRGDCARQAAVRAPAAPAAPAAPLPRVVLQTAEGDITLRVRTDQVRGGVAPRLSRAFPSRSRLVASARRPPAGHGAQAAKN